MPKDPRSIRISDFTYDLPEERIAKFPLHEREASKLLVFANDEITEYGFNDLPHLLHKEDLLVFNESKVIRARLFFEKASGAMLEVFCLAPADGVTESEALSSLGFSSWKCMVRGLKKWKNEVLEQTLPDGSFVLRAHLADRSDGDTATVRFEWSDDKRNFAQVLDAMGQLPIPPYLKREAEAEDLIRYQTVYAGTPGSVAAPTAGLHFSDSILNRLKAAGIKRENVTLHVGAGTFLPVKSEMMEGHTMHEESIEVSVGLLQRLALTKGRIIAVGTTSMRTLESLYWWAVKAMAEGETVEQWPWLEGNNADFNSTFTRLSEKLVAEGKSTIRIKTRLLIAPGYSFKVVDGLITNFHQPGSTLLLLVAAFAGPKWREIYSFALKNDFRFLSFGDSSLIFPNEVKSF